jgi:diguanylate cyclase (GGDEF)-like protein/PAS domain S-box-containing protein
MSKISTDFLDSLFEGAYLVDKNRKILYWNKAAERITGYKKADIINKHCYDNILNHVDEHGNHLCHHGCPLQKSIQTNEKLQASVFLHHRKGHRVPVQVRTYPIRDDNSDASTCIEVFSDLPSKANIYHENRQLKVSLYLDELTQVHNRKFIMYQLEQLISQTTLFNLSFGVLFIDIDHFKSINDTYGHQAGDEVLKMVAKTLEANIRNGDFIGRFGGEEFIILLKNISKNDLPVIAEKFRMLIQNSVSFYNEQAIKVTISIGGSHYQKNDTIESLIERADNMMYQAKNSGRNKVIID